MKHPERPHFGAPTPTLPVVQYGKHAVNAQVPLALRNRVPSAIAAIEAIAEAPRASDLPEPSGVLDSQYYLRIPPVEFTVFEEKREGLARGAYLRRVLHWKWGS